MRAKYDWSPRGRAKWLLGKSWDLTYKFVAKTLRKDAEVVFMNFGFDPDEGDRHIELEEADEPNRLSIQLYDFVANGAGDPAGLEMLEVSCGHGGGASYIARYLKPKRYVGLDRTEEAVDFCQRNYQVPNLEFVQGDAMDLQFEEDTFDAMVNVEASHSYPDFPRFLSEAFRVLKPGGHLLWVDFRLKKNLEKFESRIAASDFEVVHSEDISQRVFRALRIDNERKMEVIRSRSPKFAHGFMGELRRRRGLRRLRGHQVRGPALPAPGVAQAGGLSPDAPTTGPGARRGRRTPRTSGR